MNSAQEDPKKPEDETDQTSRTAGALLREAREAQGLHIAALAVAMKVPVKKLEALEADRLHQTSDAVFVRALASGVCRALKIDAGPILAKLPRSPIPRLAREERAVNAAFTDSVSSRQWSLPEVLTKPASMGVIALVIGAGVLLLLPDSLPELARGDYSQAPVVSASSPTKPGVFGDVATATSDKLADNPAPAASAPPQIAEGAQAIAVGRSASAPVGPDVAGSTSGLVVFHVRGSSWVEVTDSRGVVQLRKTLQAGDKAAASGELPLSVIIGRADVTDVEVRGKPFALDSVAKDNVARFEVK
jgi:cytoskeleton protein RodZ